MPAWPHGLRGHPSFRPADDSSPSGKTVDGLVEREGLAPGFVKIDVEGAEWFTVRGMRRTLREHRPVDAMASVNHRSHPR